ncbi:hypothetical protein ACET9O_01095 [Aeromonas caviae]|uniref:hypothetical protein n=1 Tax=Aeromonas caviae TaxID=648 RepID=UPI001F3F63B4|nr:hypothetical protein [Aeromonas caviae]
MQRALLTSASVTAILVYVSVSPLVLMTTFGLPPEQYTRLMMAMAGVSMSASFLTPLLLRWLGKARVLALSHLAYLLALLALLCSSGPKAACPGCWRGVPWSASGFPAGSGWRWGRRWMRAGIRWHRPVPCSASCR